MLNILQVYFEEKNKHCSCPSFWKSFSRDSLCCQRYSYLFQFSDVVKNTRINSAISKCEEVVHNSKETKLYIIPHLHNLFLFQCDVTRSLNRYEARSKLFIDQGRTTLYRQLRYIGQYRCNAVYIGRLLQRASYDTCDSLLIHKNYYWCLMSLL